MIVASTNSRCHCIMTESSGSQAKRSVIVKDQYFEAATATFCGAKVSECHHRLLRSECPDPLLERILS